MLEGEGGREVEIGAPDLTKHFLGRGRGREIGRRRGRRRGGGEGRGGGGEGGEEREGEGVLHDVKMCPD